jgi:hypothetical protein
VGNARTPNTVPLSSSLTPLLGVSTLEVSIVIAAALFSGFFGSKFSVPESRSKRP